jgi:predicted nucleic-acid-binding Zn-ribbon protein
MSVEDEIAVLRGEVRRLREELGERRESFSMRRQVRCPGCGCRKILHAKQVLDRAHGGGTTPMALAQMGSWFPDEVGRFEAYVCTDCGLTEWYVPDLSELKLDGQIFTLLEPPEGGGPFR